MTMKELRELLDLLIERGIHEFEMERGNLKIRVKRDAGSRPPAAGTPPEPVVVVTHGIEAPGTPPPAPRPAAPAPVPEASPPEAGREEAAKEVFIVKSPMVGTLYRVPNPNAPPFVNVGDVVEMGQVLCIVEAMKLMNEIESEVAGEVVRIYVENGQPVEYGQSLFALNPSRKK